MTRQKVASALNAERLSLVNKEIRYRVNEIMRLRAKRHFDLSGYKKAYDIATELINES